MLKREEFTDIIVGAGSGGSVVAARLSTDPDRRVLLIEAGPDYSSAESTPADLRSGNRPSQVWHDWEWTFSGPDGRILRMPRGKVVGGCSAVNACVALRPCPGDLDAWAAAGNHGWAWGDVLPYFVRLEHDLDFKDRYHGLDGPIQIRRAQRDELQPLSQAFLDHAIDAGYHLVLDHNAPDSSGVGPLPSNCIDDVRISTALAYLAPARKQSRLTIMADTMVSRILFQNLKAVGVELYNHQEARRVYADRVIVAGGALSTPTILMRSGIGPAVDLKRLEISVLVNLPGVGQNLRDHAQVPLAVIPKDGLVDEKQSGTQVVLRYTSSTSNVANDMQLFILNHVEPAVYAPYLAATVGSRILSIAGTVLVQPLSTGTVTIRTTDIHQAPEISLDYCAHPEDMRRYREGLRVAWQLWSESALASVAGDFIDIDKTTITSDAQLDRYIRTRIQTAHHPTGTAKMGPETDDMAVVDPMCRVHGVTDLYVCDASIMPTSIRANTNLTCIMIGERAADVLLGKTTKGFSSVSQEPAL